ncbi:hypothetical protein [Nocardiopsis sp. JB363]|uniref:hypothetical protein n=1 Tax=Nocardiopsis sp. JB363 TaxID=1434837 RepID=UPI001F3285BA|nr:hypothetical protein [Nocardiopsis sp. JB363]
MDVETQKLSLQDAEGIINPLTFPDPSVSVGYVEAMASGLRELGTSIADTGNDITGSWAGLSPHYSAPESETLFSVLDPVATDGDTVGEELGRAARALENFAGDVADIKTRWSNLRVEAYDLRSRIAAEGDDWDKGGGLLGFGDSPLVEENKALIDQGGKIITDYTEVENTCANAINNGIAGRTQFEQQPEGDAELDPNVFYHGFEQDLSELAVEWGHESAQTDHGWWVDASHAVWDFGVDAVEGVGAMVGAHSSQGWFEASWGDALKEYHWDNLTSAASLVGMYDAESDSLGWNGGEGVGEAWKDLAHSVVPWEEWGDRPGYVIGTAALNVIGLVGGAALTATGVGAVVGVPLMAWRGMSIVDGMGGSGRGGGGGADIDLPDVSQVPRFGGSGSPLINLAGRALDATGYGPSQLADLKAMVSRLLPSGQSGAESAGSSSTQTGGEAEGGRPGSARPPQGSAEVDQRSIQRPAQDSAMDDPGEPVTPAAADTRVSVGSDTGEAGSGRSGAARPVQTTGEVDQSPDQDSATAGRSEPDTESSHSEDETGSENLTDHLDGDESVNGTDPEPRKDEVTEGTENSRAVSEDPNQGPRVSDVAEADSLLQSLADSFTPEQRAGFENAERNLSDLETQEPRPRLSDEQVNARIQSDPSIKNIDAEMHERASNYPGFWEADPTGNTGNGPDHSQQPAYSAARPDSDSAHAQNSGSSHRPTFNLGRSDGSLSDGDRAGERDTRNDGSSDSRDDTRTRDHGPAASHNNENPAPSKNSGPQDTPSPIRNNEGGSPNSERHVPATPARRDLGDFGDRNGAHRSSGEPTADRSSAHPTGPVHHKDGPGPDPEHRRDGADRDGEARREGSDPKRTDRDEDSSRETTRKDDDGGTPKPTPPPESNRSGKEDLDSDSQTDKDSSRGKDNDPVSVPKHRDDAQAKAHDLLRTMDLGTGKDFVKNFVKLVNSKEYGTLLERAFYNVNGDRFRVDISVNGQSIPILVRGDVSSPWIPRNDLPEPDPPRYHPGSIGRTRDGVEVVVLQKLDSLAKMRKLTLSVYKRVDGQVQELKKKFDKDKSDSSSRELDRAREERRPIGRLRKIVTEAFGENSAEQAVKENFTGKNILLEEVRRDEDGKIVKDEKGKPIVDKIERRLPGLAEDEPGSPNPIPTSENAPKNGNDQFDQIWRTDDGGFIIVEAKGSLETSLGERTIKVGDGENELKRVSQGSREYFDDILREMKSRGGEERVLALKIEEVMLEDPGKIHYAEARGNPGSSGDYQGNSMKLFNIFGKGK